MQPFVPYATKSSKPLPRSRLLGSVSIQRGSKSERQFGVDSPIHFDVFRANGRRGRFLVMGMQKAAADDGDFTVRRRLPSQARI